MARMRMQKFVVLAAVLVFGCKGKGSDKTAAPSVAPTVAPAVVGPVAPPVAPTAAKPTLPGACVDPLADATTRLKSPDTESDPPSANPSPDLDGDGVADQVFTGGPISGHNENGLVYVMRGVCGHYVGNVTTTITELPTPIVRHHDLADIKVPEVSACEGSQCGCDPGWKWFRFDGKAYAEDVAAGQPSHSKECN